MREWKTSKPHKKWVFWAYRSNPGIFPESCYILCRFVSLQLTWNCLTFHLTYRYCVGNPPIMSSTLCQNSAFHRRYMKVTRSKTLFELTRLESHPQSYLAHWNLESRPLQLILKECHMMITPWENRAKDYWPRGDANFLHQSIISPFALYLYIYSALQGVSQFSLRKS